MTKISLESAARLSKLVAKDFNKGASMDFTYQDGTAILVGTYRWGEVKQFVRELAEALDMPLEVATPKVEPIVLPRDVYDEVYHIMEYLYCDATPAVSKRRADEKLWSLCRSDNEEGLAHYIANTAGASIDIARIFMKELPFECEKERGWVLTIQSGNYLSKAYINESGGWSLEYSRDIKDAIKFSAYAAAVKLEDTVAHVSTLEIEEV